MIRTVVIDKEVVALSYDEHNGKVTPGRLQVVPIGIWNKIYERRENEKVH